MTRRNHAQRRPGRAGNAPAAAAAIVAMLLLTSCSTDSIFGSATPAGGQASPSFTQRFSSLFSTGASTDTTGSTGNLPSADIDCPLIDVRPGASTFSVNAASAGDASALGLRYQGTLGQTARECMRAGTNVIMKVGIQGRVILGPAGQPGPIEVPLRLAVVREGPEPQTVWTKFYRIPLDIPPGQTNVPFTQVEPDVTFPMPATAADLQSYVVYVGFDPMGLRQQPERKPQRKR